MIHQYQLNGYNIVLDVYSGSVHVVDEVAYDVIALYETTFRTEYLARAAALGDQLLAEFFDAERGGFYPYSERGEQLLTRTKDIYRLIWKDLRIDGHVLRRIFSVGLPAGIQSVITAFSNVFVQSYVNYFGSGCMAGWSCYNKLDQFIMLPMQSMAMAATTFVSQNIGAGKDRRADRGTLVSLLLSCSVTGVIAALLVIFAAPAVRLFSPDSEVIRFGVLFIRTNVFFLLFNCINHVLAGALRGRGDSAGPMIIMLSCFVAARQLYLYLITHFVANTPRVVGFGYPVGWMLCCAVELSYYFIRRRRRLARASAA